MNWLPPTEPMLNCSTRTLACRLLLMVFNRPFLLSEGERPPNWSVLVCRRSTHQNPPAWKSP